MKKTKRKEYYQGNKEKMQKRLREYNKNRSEDEENYAKIMNKNILDTNRKKKKEYMKNYYYKNFTKKYHDRLCYFQTLKLLKLSEISLRSFRRHLIIIFIEITWQYQNHFYCSFPPLLNK